MLKQQIQNDATQALKEGNKETVDVLRLVLSVILSKEKEKRYKISKQEQGLAESELEKKSVLTDEELTDTLLSEVKKRKEAIVFYQKGQRPELVQKEKNEIEVIKKYLPEQLSLEELKKMIEESIDKVGAKEIHPVKSAEGGVAPEAQQFNRVKDIRKVMADLIPKVKGRADNSEIGKILKELLNK